jgi:hypothetical protein
MTNDEMKKERWRDPTEDAMLACFACVRACVRACVACVSVVELGDIVTSCILDEKILLELRSRAVSSYCMHTCTLPFTVLAAASLPSLQRIRFFVF